jgi:tetratricopeptide (TPR) repeat protein
MRCFLSLVIRFLMKGVLAFVPVVAGVDGAELPSVQELIRQTSETCRRVRTETDEIPDWGLMELANAQAWAGDYTAALETARSVSVKGFREITLANCWVIEFERTGVIEPFPVQDPGNSEIEQSLYGTVKVSAAQALAKAGKLDEAKKFLPQDRGDRECGLDLTTFYMALAEDQFRHGDRGGTAASLREAWTIAARFDGDVYFHIGWIHTMVDLWLKLGDKPNAKVGKDSALAFLQRRGNKENPSKTLALAWARQGKLHAVFGENELAREAFVEAIQTANGADEINKAEGLYDSDFRAGEHAEVLGRIGAWQLAAGVKDDAQESFRKALTRLDEIKEELKRDHNLLKIVDLQRGAGVVDEALKSIERMKSVYYRASACCHCAETLSSGDRKAEARQLLLRAVELADGKRDPDQTPHMLVEIAETKAKVADLTSARPYYQKAIEISLATQDHNWHQAIARSQLRLGLFEDAYETALGIPNLYYRSLPLAELTEEVAKKEALARKKEIKK